MKMYRSGHARTKL